MAFFKKKQVLKTVAEGNIIPLEEVKDEVFSSKMMGEGFAVVNHDGKIYAPITGTITNIFPTLHAITIKSAEGVAVLVHMGLDTVSLKGAPFSIKVQEGEHVDPATLLATMDLAQLEIAKKDAAVIVVLPEIKKGKLLKANQQVAIQEAVFKF